MIVQPRTLKEHSETFC